MVDPMKAPAPGNRLPFRRGSVEYCLGTEADHEAIYQTLLHVFHGPDRESFLGALSDPVYRPDQRLLAKVDGRIVSHVHLTERQLRYGSVSIPINGVMWVGTLPEFRGMGFAQNLMRLASMRARENGVVLQVLTTGMPQFYRPLGWGVCGRQTFAQTMSRNLPQVSDGVIEGRGAILARPALATGRARRPDGLYELQYAQTTGTIVRSEEYWRWMIGRKYAHVIWVACQGETVRGYAFIKDHKVLEIAYDPSLSPGAAGFARPGAGRGARAGLSGSDRVRPQRSSGHRCCAGGVRARSSTRMRTRGRYRCIMFPTSGGFLKCILPELARRATESGCALPLGAGHLPGRRTLADPQSTARTRASSPRS